MSSEASHYAEKVIKAHLRSNRLSHAYLIQGQDTDLMKSFLVQSAKALQCNERNYFLPCQCLSCRKIDSLNHPDVEWVGEDRKVKSIKIEEIRQLIHAASLKPFEGAAKIFILVEAHRMTHDAANAFLKTLEEPPQSTYFLLQTSNPAQILETIRSRCFTIRMPFQELDESELQFPGRWTDWTDQHQSTPRVELSIELDHLLNTLRMRLAQEKNRAAFSLLGAIDATAETKDALNDNVNQKLALTRLAVRLEKWIPAGTL